MSEPIGEAFVRVRGETSGFKQSAQPGVVAGMKDIALTAAKTFGVIFGAEKLFHFGADAISEAALTQKATENIKAQFGSAADDVLRFSDSAAGAFGISKHASEDFSSSIGLVTKNLGLGKREGADMAVGLEKLAGSVGLIKGQDPTGYFDKLKLALLGNTRGLKQMGISLDTTTISQYALDHGIIKSTVDHAKVAAALEKSKAATAAYRDAVAKTGKDSAVARSAQIKMNLAHDAYKKTLDGTVGKLSAAQKAQAIYGLATQKLGTYMTQAKSHTGDWADEQIKLKAELSNVKEEIGAALLPVMASLGSILLADVIPAISGTVGAFKDLINFIPTDVLKGLGIGISIVTGLWIVYTVVQYAAATALAVMNAAFAISPIGLLVIAVIGLIATLYVLYNRFQIVRTIVQAVFGFVQSFIPAAIAFVKDAITSGINLIIAAWNRFALIRQTVAAVFGFVRDYIHSTMTIIHGVINIVMGLIQGDWGRVWQGIKQVLSGALGIMLALIRNFGPLMLAAAIALGKAVFNGVKQGVGDLAGWLKGKIQALPGALGDVGSILKDAGIKLIEGFISGITSKLGDVKDTLTGLASSAVSWKGPPAKDRRLLIPAGQLMIQGFIEGLQREIPNVKGTLSPIAPNILRDLSATRLAASLLPAPGTALAGAGAGGNSSALLAALGSPRAASDQSVHIEHLTIQHPDPYRVLQQVLNEVAARRPGR